MEFLCGFLFFSPNSNHSKLLFMHVYSNFICSANTCLLGPCIHVLNSFFPFVVESQTFFVYCHTINYWICNLGGFSYEQYFHILNSALNIEKFLVLVKPIFTLYYLWMFCTFIRSFTELKCMKTFGNSMQLIESKAEIKQLFSVSQP